MRRPVGMLFILTSSSDFGAPPYNSEADMSVREVWGLYQRTTGSSEKSYIKTKRPPSRSHLQFSARTAQPAQISVTGQRRIFS